jgi:hypothetical protein
MGFCALLLKESMWATTFASSAAPSKFVSSSSATTFARKIMLLVAPHVELAEWPMMSTPNTLIHFV